jgi:hypothetical protein
VTRREWRELWQTGPDDAGAAASLTELVADGHPVPGALILSVRNEEGDAGEAWLSLPYGALRELRDALDRLVRLGQCSTPRYWLALPATVAEVADRGRC